MNEIDLFFLNKFIENKENKNNLRYSTIVSIFKASNNNIDLVAATLSDAASKIYDQVMETYSGYNNEDGYLTEIVPKMIENYNEIYYKSVDMELDNVIEFCTKNKISKDDRISIIDPVVDYVLNNYSSYSIDNIKKINTKELLKDLDGINIDLSLLSNTRCSILKALVFFDHADSFLHHQIIEKSNIVVDKELEIGLMRLEKKLLNDDLNTKSCTVLHKM